MAGFRTPVSTIRFDVKAMDYLIDGTPLLESLRRHESGVSGGRPSVACDPDGCKRLVMAAPPDIAETWTALYLCDHCRGYESQPIGCRIALDADGFVSWRELGYYDEFEAEWVEYRKVKQFR